ncbi:MAG: hypothetical protein LBP88_05765 [Treponema sp.]|jgi:hypothetical protein|nr:hypothetical protein [Treponema sp.]
MRNFLCAFERIFLGIPSECVAEILQAPQDLHAMIETNPNRGEVFLSLPRLFCRADVPAPHGIRLKPLAYPETQVRALQEYTKLEVPRIVLVTPAVETEADIPPEAIRELPGVIGLLGRLSFLRGVSFTGTKMTAFIDPVLLVSRFIECEARGL